MTIPSGAAAFTTSALSALMASPFVLATQYARSGAGPTAMDSKLAHLGGDAAEPCAVCAQAIVEAQRVDMTATRGKIRMMFSPFWAFPHRCQSECEVRASPRGSQANVDQASRGF